MVNVRKRGNVYIYGFIRYNGKFSSTDETRKNAIDFYENAINLD